MICTIGATQIHQHWGVLDQHLGRCLHLLGLRSTAALSVDRLPTYSVAELNTAIGSCWNAVLRRVFCGGHGHPNLRSKKAISGSPSPTVKPAFAGVVWASKLKQLSYQPKDGDGVTVVGKLNFWAAEPASPFRRWTSGQA